MLTLNDTKFLEKCKVISETEQVKGIVLCSNHTEYSIEIKDFQVNENGVYDGTLIDEISINDIIPMDNNSTLVGNFRAAVKEILGNQKYYIEASLYDFISDKKCDIDDFDDDFIDDSKERAIAEQLEEEEAEENFDRFIKRLENGD